jgi:hypothetical protein
MVRSTAQGRFPARERLTRGQVAMRVTPQRAITHQRLRPLASVSVLGSFGIALLITT